MRNKKLQIILIIVLVVLCTQDLESLKDAFMEGFMLARNGVAK